MPQWNEACGYPTHRARVSARSQVDEGGSEAVRQESEL